MSYCMNLICNNILHTTCPITTCPTGSFNCGGPLGSEKYVFSWKLVENAADHWVNIACGQEFTRAMLNAERPLVRLHQYMATKSIHCRWVHPTPINVTAPPLSKWRWVPQYLKMCYEASSKKTNSPLTSGIIPHPPPPPPTTFEVSAHPHKWNSGTNKPTPPQPQEVFFILMIISVV